MFFRYLSLLISSFVFFFFFKYDFARKQYATIRGTQNFVPINFSARRRPWSATGASSPQRRQLRLLRSILPLSGHASRSLALMTTRHAQVLLRSLALGVKHGAAWGKKKRTTKKKIGKINMIT